MKIQIFRYNSDRKDVSSYKKKFLKQIYHFTLAISLSLSLSEKMDNFKCLANTFIALDCAVELQKGFLARRQAGFQAVCFSRQRKWHTSHSPTQGFWK
jgi:hypothetical protein